MKIYYQGIPGSYSYIAAKYFYPNEELIGLDSFEKVVDKIIKKDALAVLPIDNTLIGSIYEVYDLVFDNDLKVRAELNLKIDHNLLAKKSDRSIKKVYSHKKALAQCSSFFRNNKDIVSVEYSDTAAAAKYVSDSKNVNIAAIASNTAGGLYGLEVIKEGIQNNPNNYTRFVVIGKKNGKLRGTKSSIVYAASHTPGSLLKCLAPFAKKGLNLTKIESRPFVGYPWKYLFYLDFEHPDKNGIVKKVYEEVKPHTSIFKKIGTYEKGHTINEEGLAIKV